MGKKEKKTKKKGKRVRKGRKHESVKIWQKYEVKGEEVSRKNKFCPRCGGGTMLSNQKNRLYCGKCGYTSFGPGRPPQAEEQAPAEKKEAAGEKPAESEKVEEKQPEEKQEEAKADEKPSE